MQFSFASAGKSYLEQCQRQIIRKVDVEDDFIIECILENNLWWIIENRICLNTHPSYT